MIKLRRLQDYIGVSRSIEILTTIPAIEIQFSQISEQSIKGRERKRKRKRKRICLLRAKNKVKERERICLLGTKNKEKERESKRGCNSCWACM